MTTTQAKDAPTYAPAEAPTQTQEVAQVQRGQAVASAPPDMAAQLKIMLPEIQRSLPRHMSGDRFTRIVLTEMRKQPKLAQSTPASFFGSLLTASALGLEPGVGGECYLVPYKDGKASRAAGYDVYECQLIVGYQGVSKLFWQHPLAKRLAAEVVYANDHFRISKGLVQALEHEPATGDRGEIVGYWALAELTTGGMNYDFFTAQQIAILRNGKVGPSGDIADPEHWMEKKTALKQVLKLMPKSAHLAQALQADEQPGSLAQGQRIAFMDTASGEIVGGGDL